MAENPQAAHRVPLHGSTKHARPEYKSVGPANPKEVVRVAIKVRAKKACPDPAVQGALLPIERAAPTAYADHVADYGADQADIDKVVQFAKAHNLTVVEADAGQRMVVVTGTVADANAAFGTDLQTFESKETGRTYRGRTGEIQIPASLTGVVTVVTGLDNRRMVKRKTIGAHAGVAAGPTSFFPPELARIYNFPTDLDGTGQCIGLLEFGGGFDVNDLKTYFKNDLHAFGIKEPSIKAVSVDGTQNDPNDPDIPPEQRADPEVMLDIEVAGAIAPGAKIAVYFSSFTERGWVEAITKAVHDPVNRPSVLSVSWGFAEQEDLGGGFSFSPAVMDDIDLTLKEAANLNVTVILAAGDDGSIDGSFPDGGVAVHVDFPASSPNVLSVGGTTLQTDDNNQVTDEVVWGNGIRDDGPGHGSTGGGVSEHFTRPPWQAAADVPTSHSTGFAGRGVPDVAAAADGAYTVRFSGQPIRGEGGTSASAPLWGALIALINQRLATMPGSKAAGYFNPLIYNTLGKTTAFKDITSGSNDAHNNLDGAYTAGPGWDACSGWGSPNGKELLRALTGGGTDPQQ
jgi:kumamolisin